MLTDEPKNSYDCWNHEPYEWRSAYMTKARISVLLIALLVICLLLPVPAGAKKVRWHRPWEFNLAPFYLWAVGIDGEQTIGPKTTGIEVAFEDVFDRLNAAFTGHFEGMYKKRYGFLFDYNFINLAADKSVPVLGTVDFDFKAQIGEGAFLYRFLRRQAHYTEAIFGARYTSLDNDLKINGTSVLDGIKTWTDPIVGLRWVWNFSDAWSLRVRGDAGGFGAGSDLALQGLLIFEWGPARHVSFLGGYRALYQDYEEGSGPTFFKYQAVMHGPVLGINFRW